MIPIILAEFPREVGRWLAASAQESALNEDYVTAVAQMDRAIAWSGDEVFLYLQRADYKLHTQQWASGLEDCDRARQLAPEDDSIGDIRSRFLQHLGRHDAAIAELKELLRVESNPGHRADRLNALAYARAVGNRELAPGLEAADESLQILGSRPAILDPAGYLHYARGFTATQQGDLSLALENLNKAHQLAEAKYQRALARLQSLKQAPRGAEEYAERVRVLRSQLAGVLTLRASVLDDLQRPEDAEVDRQQIESLSPSGNIAIAKPLRLEEALQRVAASGQVLDTRGFLYYRLGDFDAARRDMQYAVETMQWACEAMKWIIEAEKYVRPDLRPLQESYRGMQHSLAVVSYHRMLVHEALGKDTEAAKDRAHVIELGYEPNDQLF